MPRLGAAALIAFAPFLVSEPKRSTLRQELTLTRQQQKEFPITVDWAVGLKP